MRYLETALRSRVVAVVLAVAAMGVCWVRLPFGYPVTWCDEGFYLTSATRYLWGDIPFRDEHFTSGISFDLVNYVLARILPLHTILDWRIAGFCIVGGSLLSLAVALRRQLGLRLSLIIFGSLILFEPYNLWTPNYKNLCVCGFCAALAFWVEAEGVESKGVARTLLCGCGLALFLSMVVFAPQAATCLALVVLLGIREVYSGRRPWRTFFLAGTMTAAVIAAIGLLSTYGLIDQVVSNLREKASFPQYNQGIVERVAIKLTRHGLFRHIGAMITIAAVYCVFLRTGRTIGRRIALGALGLSTLGLLARFVREGSNGTQEYLGTISNWLFLFNVLWVAVAVALPSVLLAQGQAVQFLVRNSLVLATGILAGAVCVVSASVFSSHIAEVNVTSWLIWIGVTVLLARLSADLRDAGHDAAKSVRLTLLGYVAFCWLFAVTHLWTWTYGDVKPWNAVATFASGRMAGLRTSNSELETTNSLFGALAKASALDEEGGISLVHPSRCELYFLTGSRPAVYSSLTDDGPIMEQWIAEAIRRDRWPQVIILTLGVGDNDPVKRLLAKNYDWVFVDATGVRQIGVLKR